MAAVSLLVWACAGEPVPVDFADPLTGPVSAQLLIPFDKYALTPGGLLRTSAESGTRNGIERPIVRTVSGDYLSRDFVFEVDVTIPADHGDIAYVGFGAGRTNLLLDNEPSEAFLFRIHNLPEMPFYGIDIAVADPEGGTGFRGAFREFSRFGDYTPGEPMRFQIAHRQGMVTLTVPSVPEARVSFDMARFHDLFADGEARLFFANSSEGTTFANAALTPP